MPISVQSCAKALLTAVLFAFAPACAWTQVVSQPAKLTVPFGETGFLDNPCPPPTPEVLTSLAEPGKPPQFDAAAVKAFERYQAYQLVSDWAYLCRYRAADRALPAKAPRVVFMGDSITEGWALYDPNLFSSGNLDRGVIGQTTPQMLVRFYQDVINLHPAVVHIMAGTNDVSGNTGPTSDDDFKNNIAAMVDLARVHGIAVILASIPPTKKFPWRPGLKPAHKIVELNAWLRSFASERHITYVDYYSSLADADGGLRADFSFDGVHPTSAGYAVMKERLLSALVLVDHR